MMIELSKRNCKNAIKRKHGILRSVCLKQKDGQLNEKEDVLAIPAIKISIKLNGNDTVCLQNRKRYSKPVNGNDASKSHDNIVNALKRSSSKHKLELT